MNANESLVSSVKGSIAVLKAQSYVNDKAADEMASECTKLASDGVQHFR